MQQGTSPDSNELLEELHVQGTRKKEITKWYNMLQTLEERRSLPPYSIWADILEADVLEPLWQVSCTTLYDTVSPANLKRNYLFTLYRA